MTNRGKKNENDSWLTPLPLVQMLGPFDLDPCCPTYMPWRTADRMLTLGDKMKSLKVKMVNPLVVDGLSEKWSGEVFLNNPFSKPMPWIEKMVEHRKGVVLAPAKSTETKWCQLLLSTCDIVLFLDDRISFCHPDGTQSKGSWSPYVLCGYGKRGVTSVIRASKCHEYRGVLMKRVS